MGNASQDANGRSTLLGVSSVDGKTPIPIKVNPITGRVLIEFTGTVTGIQPSGTPFTVGQIATYLATDGFTVGALGGSGYIKLTAGVPSVLSAIVASDITQSASYRFVTDTEKTTWNAKQNALGYTAENTANKGVANGYAGLDATGKVPSAQLPSFVDDVLEFANLAGFPGTGETGKMYIALDTNKVYRWSGSVYVEISGSPGSTDAVTEGATNLYFTTARVLGTLLAGLSTATNAVITASDSVLSALGKLQKQISDNLTTLNALTTTVGTKATDTAVVHIANTETVTGQKKFNKIVESNMDNTTSGAGIRANGLDHIYYEWLVNLVRKAYIGFGGAGNIIFAITNEMTNGDINFATNGTGRVTTNGEEVGYKNIPQNSQSVAYTAVLADAGKHIYHPSADTTARTFTIPANASVAYPIGTAITFVNDTSAGTLTIAITTDTLVLAGAGTTGSRTLTANGVATAIKVTSTRWIISGTNLT